MRNVAGKNEKPASELKEFAKDRNLKITVLEMDVTSDESVAAAVANIPQVDVLINNAGLGYGGPIESFSSQQVLDQLDLNIVSPKNGEVANAYEHVGAFFQGFQNQVMSAFAEINAPTDPMLVVKSYEDLIDMPAGSRPLRTMVGLDFGLQSLNDAVEPIRKGILESMGLSEMDGPKA
jgi:NAD(P)-dependent dehydrogenase (short-subunit alcohol dehydrogenase family)